MSTIKLKNIIPEINVIETWNNTNSDNGTFIKRYQTVDGTSDSVVSDIAAETGTAQSGSLTTITLSAGSNALDDYYNGWWVYITGGTGSGQIRKIKDYNGTSKVATIYSNSDVVPEGNNFSTSPDATSIYSMFNRTYVSSFYDESVNTWKIGYSSEVNSSITTQELANLTVNDFTVLGAFSNGGITSEGQFIVDHTDPKALLVRKDGDSGDVFIVDTTNSSVEVSTGSGLSINTSNVTSDTLRIGYNSNLPQILLERSGGTVTSDILVDSANTLCIRNQDGTNPCIDFILSNAAVNDGKVRIYNGRLQTGANNHNITPEHGVLIQSIGNTFTDNITAGSGTATVVSFNSFEAPELAATNASVTTTDVSTVYIEGAPTAGTNQTITNSYALWVDAGATRFDGSVQFNGNVDFDANVVVDTTNTEAFLVRKNSDTGDVFIVDSTNTRVGVGKTPVTTLDIEGTTRVKDTLVIYNPVGGGDGGQLVLGFPGADITGESASSWNIDVDNSNNLRFFVSGGVTALTFTSSTGKATFDGCASVDCTDTEAFLVRKNGDTGDLFTVDTTNEKVIIGSTGDLYLQDAATSSYIYFDDTDYIQYSKSLNNMWFRIGGDIKLNIASAQTTSEQKFIVDTTSTEAFLVRKDGDSGDVFAVDTLNDCVEIISSDLQFYGDRTGNSSESIRSLAFTFTDDDTVASGTASARHLVTLAPQTIAATNASVTTTNAATMYIGGAPISGTNQTITNAYSLWVDSGASRFGGDILLTGNSNSAYLTTDAASSDSIFIKNSDASTATNLSIINNGGGSGTGLYIFQSGTSTATGEFLCQTYDGTKWVIQASNATGAGTAKDITLEAGSNTSGGTHASQLRLNTDGSVDLNANVVVDDTSTEAFLVRKNSDTGDVFKVDTTNSAMGLNANALASGRFHIGYNTGSAQFCLERSDGNTGFCLIIDSNSDAVIQNPSGGKNISLLVNASGSSTVVISNGTLDFSLINSSLYTINVNTVIDRTSSEAFLVRKDADGGDMFIVDTENSNVEVVGANLELYGDRTGNISDTFRMYAYTFTDSSTSASSTSATDRIAVRYDTPTLAATNTSVTTTNAATMYIAGAPIAGANQTITNSYALWVDAGTARFDGDVIINGSLIGDSVTYESLIVDSTGTEALLIRKDDDTGDVFKVDTTNSIVTADAQVIIDTTSTEAFLVRKDGDSKDVFTVNTDTEFIAMRSRAFISLDSSVAFVVEESGGTDIFIVDTISDIVTVNGSITVTGNVDGRDISTDGSTLDNLNTTLGLGSLTAAEVTQLQNIDTTTISSTQWGYLGATDQSVTTADNVQFNKVIVDSSSTDSFRVRKNGSGTTVFNIDTTNDITSIKTHLILEGNQNFEFDAASGAGIFSNHLSIQSQTSGVANLIGMYTKDADGTDDNILSIFASGAPTASSNYSRLVVGYDQSLSSYLLVTDVDGTGTNYPITIETSGNSNQLKVNTNGSVTLSDNTGSTGVGTGTLQVTGGAYFGNSVYLDDKTTIDKTATDAFVVRQDSAGNEILKVDTTNEKVYINGIEVTPFAATTFSAANNVTSPANVTGLAFAESSVRSFKVLVTIVIDATVDLYTQVELRGLQKATGIWIMSSNEIGDESNILFTITSSGGNGQVQYTSGNEAGFVSSTFTFSVLEQHEI